MPIPGIFPTIMYDVNIIYMITKSNHIYPIVAYKIIDNNNKKRIKLFM